MHPTLLFFVLLFLPNSSLTDWQSAQSPHLKQVMQEGAIGLMNDRTAEVDEISRDAGIQSIFAGARLSSIPAASGSPADPLVNNIEDSLALAGNTRVQNINWPEFDFHQNPPSPHLGDFIAVVLPGDMAEADREIVRWVKEVSQNHGELLIVSPNPTCAEYAANDQLTPAVLWGPGIQRGYLTSASTRTKGLIVNTDIAPTIAAYFNTSLVGSYYGAEIKTAPGSANHVQQLIGRQQLWMTQAKMLRILPYIAALIACLVVVATVLRQTGSAFGERIAALTMCIPLLLLFSIAWRLMLMAAAVLLLVIMLNRHYRFLVERVVLFACLCVTADQLFLSGRVFGNSLLGYSPIEGARYYGIGNETMGVYIGLLTVISSWFFERWRIAAYAALWISAGLVVALPMFGAKAGGLIVCALTLSVTVSVVLGARRFDLKMISLAALAVLIAVGLLIAFSHIGPRTHVSEALALAKRSGSATIGQTIIRKAAMDLHLVFHSVWILVLLTTSVGRLLCYRSSNGTNERSPILAIAGTAAIVACLLFNDAGVVAAALCSLIVWGAEIAGLSLQWVKQDLHIKTL